MPFSRIGEWASASSKDLPNEYMQRLITELIVPAFDTLRLGPDVGMAVLAPKVVTGVINTLLAHLLKMKGRISRQGAKRLQLVSAPTPPLAIPYYPHVSFQYLPLPSPCPSLIFPPRVLFRLPYE